MISQKPTLKVFFERATALLCQGLAEHMLAAHLALGIDGEELPNGICSRIRC
jgi:hypothetical protein